MLLLPGFGPDSVTVAGPPDAERCAANIGTKNLNKNVKASKIWEICNPARDLNFKMPQAMVYLAILRTQVLAVRLRLVLA